MSRFPKQGWEIEHLQSGRGDVDVSAVEQLRRDVFDIDDALWSSVTVLHPHGPVRDYEGSYVAWREGGVHVSAPSSATVAEVSSLTNEAGVSLQDARFWQAFAHQRGLTVLGPSTHHYLDIDPGRGDDVVEVTVDQLAQLRPTVRPEEWVESGMAHDDSQGAFGAFRSGLPVAAAALDDWRDEPTDIGVLVDPTARGRGLATEGVRSAASYAPRAH